MSAPWARCRAIRLAPGGRLATWSLAGGPHGSAANVRSCSRFVPTHQGSHGPPAWMGGRLRRDRLGYHGCTLPGMEKQMRVVFPDDWNGVFETAPEIARL